MTFKRKAPDTPEEVAAKQAKLGDLIDQLYEARAARLVAQKALDAQKKREGQLKLDIRAILAQSGLDGASGRTAKVFTTTREIPVVEDYAALFDYVVANRETALDLLPKSVLQAAVKMRWEDDQDVPGVGSFRKEELSVRKV